MPRQTLWVFGLLLIGCDDGDPSAAIERDEAGAPIERDEAGRRVGGALSDGAPGDGAAPDSGWTGTDGGVVEVRDGGVVVEERGDGGITFVCYPTTCADKLLECGDCVDNDGDGRVDWRDPACLVPCDNTEGAALAPGVGGEGGNTCQVDCFFDFGNGPGNDDCHWDRRCDPLEPERAICAYDAALVGGRRCPPEQSDRCNETCRQFTPNGCDCFGCCAFPEIEGHVYIGALDEQDNNRGTCTFADIGDPERCPPCTPVPGCYNDCGPCEVCIGRPEPPPECFPDARPDGGVRDGGAPRDGGAGGDPDGGAGGPDGGVAPDASRPPPQCPGDLQACGLPGLDPCPPPAYCITGCCLDSF